MQADSFPTELSGLYPKVCLPHMLPPRFSSECQEDSESGPGRVSPRTHIGHQRAPTPPPAPHLSATRSGGGCTGCRAPASPTQPSTSPADCTHHQADPRCHRGPAVMRARALLLRQRLPRLPSSPALGRPRACRPACGCMLRSSCLISSPDHPLCFTPGFPGSPPECRLAWTLHGQCVDRVL